MKNYILIITLLLIIVVLSNCSTAKKAAAAKSDAHRYTYTADVAPILVERCTPCHFPNGGKKKFLDTHEAVSSTIDDILYRVQLPHDDPKFMPFKSKKEPLSDSLIMVIKLWKDQGMVK